jgi:quinol monooxygenase YgiN
MVVEYIRYTIEDPARQKALIDSYRQAANSLDAAPECLAYELSQCEEEPSSLVLRIEWESTNAHLNGFRKGPHFRGFFAVIGDYVKAITEMRHYEVTNVARRK